MPRRDESTLQKRAESDAEADVLDLDELVDAVLRAFPAEPRLLDATEWRNLGRQEPGVDGDHPCFERFGHSPDAADVAAVEVRRQAELGVIGQRDGFLFGL